MNPNCNKGELKLYTYLVLVIVN